MSQMTNEQLRKIIQRIEIDKDSNVDIYLRLLEELSVDYTVAVENTVPRLDDRTYGCNKIERFIWIIE